MSEKLAFMLFGICVGALIGSLAQSFINTKRDSGLRKHAEDLAFVQIVDDTTPIKEPEGAIEIADFKAFNTSYGSQPVLHVQEWSGSGIVGAGRGPSKMQWTCSPGYELKFDGGIPYCAPNGDLAAQGKREGK